MTMTFSQLFTEGVFEQFLQCILEQLCGGLILQPAAHKKKNHQSSATPAGENHGRTNKHWLVYI